MWEDMARNYDPNQPELMDKLQAQWEKAFEEWDESKLNEHWEVAQDIIEGQNIVSSGYQSSAQNPYINHNSPHRAFLECISKADSQGAILALEAHVQKHP
jgi:DNA-binding GntR family transcriptional regulator